MINPNLTERQIAIIFESLSRLREIDLQDRDQEVTVDNSGNLVTEDEVATLIDILEVIE